MRDYLTLFALLLTPQLPAASRLRRTGDVSANATADFGQIQSAETRVWDGEDLSEDASSKVEMTASSTSGSDLEMKIQIFGLYNTGTNVLQMVLHEIYPKASICPDTSYSRELNGGTCHHFYPVSKHDNPWHIEDHMKWAKDNGVHMVFITRNPVSNLLSNHVHPYGLFSCTGPKIDDWLTTPCNCRYMDNVYPYVQLCKPGQSEFSSVIDVWNEFAEGHLKLSSQTGSDGPILVRYEDLVLSPEDVFKRIAIAFTGKAPVDEIAHTMETSAKADGVGRSKALHKIQTKSYRNDPLYSQHLLELLCSKLSKPLLERLDYADECA